MIDSIKYQSIIDATMNHGCVSRATMLFVRENPGSVTALLYAALAFDSRGSPAFRHASKPPCSAQAF